MGTATIRQRVSAEERRALRELAASDAPGEPFARARIVAAVLDGTSPAVIARRAGLPRTTVYSWLRRFASSGTSGLCSRRRAGRDMAGG